MITDDGFGGQGPGGTSDPERVAWLAQVLSEDRAESVPLFPMPPRGAPEVRITVEVARAGAEDSAGVVAHAELTPLGEGFVRDWTIASAEIANETTGAPAWERRGLLARVERAGTFWRLVERAAKWAAEQAEGVP